MKVQVSGNQNDKFEKITWNDLPLSKKHETILESINRGVNIELTVPDIREAHDELIRWYEIMKTQHGCIDLMEERSSEEILKIWTEIDKIGGVFHLHFHMFSPFSFYPNPEVFKESLFRESFSKKDFSQYDLDYMEWDSEQRTEIKIMPENEAEILAMNQCHYNELRYKAYHEKGHLGRVDTRLMKWAKGLKKDIYAGIQKTPVSLDDYRKTYLSFIHKQIDQYKVDSHMRFRQIFNEELERLTLGADLISGRELIQEEYGTFDICNDDIKNLFDPSKFMYRIIANDIAQITLDLENGNFFPSTPTAGTDRHGIKSKNQSTQKTFNWESNPEKELPELFEKMKGTLIAPETTLEQFTAIFTGHSIESIQPVNWLKGPTLLAYFIGRISSQIGYPKNQWSIAESCFEGMNRKTLGASYARFNDNTNPKHPNKPKNHRLIDILF